MASFNQGKQEGMRLLAMSVKEREKQRLPVTNEDIADYLFVHISTVARWQQERQNYLQQLKNSDERRKKNRKVNTEEDDYHKVYDALMEMVIVKHNAFASKILLQLMGKLIEKQEVTVIDGSLITRAAIKAIRELREQGYGMDEVPKELAVLRPNLRLPAGQSKRANAKVRVVAPLTETVQVNSQ